jgi:hypothetical protein
MYIWMDEGLVTTVSISIVIPLPAGSSLGSENFLIEIPVRPLKAKKLECRMGQSH